MNTNYFYVTISATLLAACNLAKEDTREFIPGTYVTSFKDTLAVVNDTFYIHGLTTSGGDQYAVINSMSFQQNIDGHLQPLQWKTNKWTGNYDERNNTILVNQTGAILAFDPAKKEMKLGTVSYKKAAP